MVTLPIARQNLAVYRTVTVRETSDLTGLRDSFMGQTTLNMIEYLGETWAWVAF